MLTKYYKYMSGEEFAPMPDKEFFKMIEENNKVLNECNNHDFSKQIQSKCWACIHCHGVIDTCNKNFYELGKTHAVKEIRDKEVAYD